MDTAILKRSVLVPILALSSRELVEGFGSVTQASGGFGEIRVFATSDLSILYRTPSAGIVTAPSNFGIDVWYKHKKTFSVIWNSHKYQDVEVICFKRGPWIPMLLELAGHHSQLS